MTAIEKLLTRTRAAADQRAATHHEQYTKLVRRCAEGADVEPGKILDQLDKWGRDAATFQRDVETVAARLDAAAEYGAGASRRTALAIAEAKAAEIVRDLEASVVRLRAEAEALLVPLRAEIETARRALKASEAAGNRLHDTAPAEVTARFLAAQKRAGVAREAVGRALASQRKAEGRVLDLRAGIARYEQLTPYQREAYKVARIKAEEELPGAEADEQAAQERLAELRAKLDEAEAERAAAERELFAV